jgi:hypothetical protein
LKTLKLNIAKKPWKVFIRFLPVESKNIYSPIAIKNLNSYAFSTTPFKMYDAAKA